jgi:cation diffusion facilitator CzcD-associated flavoprotein CzcO
VHHPRTAQSLKPWYRQFCKRPTFSDDYLPTFNRPNVTLIDTQGRGLEAITADAFVFAGIEHKLDCIIFATGFEVGTGWGRRSGCEIYGRDAQSLWECWKDGLQTFHGFYTHGFPNLFHMGVTQNGASYSYTFCTDEQAEHIAALLKHARARNARRIEPTAQAQQEWVATIRRLSGANAEFFRECTPGYFNNEGRTEKTIGFFQEVYGRGPIEFHELIRNWRAGDMLGLEFS